MDIELCILDNPIIENNYIEVEEILKSTEKDAVFFGEGVLQGDLSFDYEKDIRKSSSDDSMEIVKMRKLAKEYKKTIGFGYYENDRGSIFNSYMVIGKDGEILGNFRAVSDKWIDESQSYNADYRTGENYKRIKVNGEELSVFIGYDLAEEERYIDAINHDEEIILWVNNHDTKEEDIKYVCEIFVRPMLYIGKDKTGRLFQGKMDLK